MSPLILLLLSPCGRKIAERKSEGGGYGPPPQFFLLLFSAEKRSMEGFLGYGVFEWGAYVTFEYFVRLKGIVSDWQRIFYFWLIPASNGYN